MMDVRKKGGLKVGSLMLANNLVWADETEHTTTLQSELSRLPALAT